MTDRVRRLTGALLGAACVIVGAGVAAAADARALEICVIHNSADHPSITAVVEGMNDEAAIYGAKVTAFDPAMDPQKQAAMIEDCIARKPGAIAINAVDPATVVPGIRKAAEAGIPVVMQNADTTEQGRAYTKAFIGSQSYDQGFAVGQMIVKALGGKGNVVVITGKPGQTDTVNRTEGMKAAFADANTSSATPGNLANVARQISLDAPLVLGQALVLIAGGIDISLGSTMAMAGALAAGLQDYGTPVAVAAALAFGLGVGALNGLLVTRFGIVPFVATLGTMSLVRGLLLTYTQQQSIPITNETLAWLGSDLGPLPLPLLSSLALLALLSLMLSRTRTGRDLYATGGNREAAYLAGVAVDRSLFLAFLASGLLAALAGVLLAARLNAATVQLGMDTPLLTISAAMIGGASLLGGRGTMLGAFLGLVALGVLNNGMNLLGVHTHYQIAIRALILVSVVALDALGARLARRRAAARAVAG